MGQDPKKSADKNAKSLKNKFESCALCAGSGASGLLLGHLGCIAAASATFIGVTAAAGASLVSAGIGAAATAAGLGLWWKLGGKKEKPVIKRLVIGSALSGFILMNAWHAATTHHADHQMQGQYEDAFSPQSKKWFDGLSPEARLRVAQNARRQNMSIARYVNTQICGTGTEPAPNLK